jgi:hypothetical protein
VELLTGLSASRVGMPPHLRGIGPEISTLPEVLQSAGYTTVHLGKWHLGQDLPSAFPDRQGFAEWFGFLHALETKNGPAGPAQSTYMNPWLRGSDRAPAPVSGHLTDILTDAAIARIISLAAEQAPWFINLWYFAPHTPVEPAARFAAQFPDTAEGRYLALVAQLDASVGRLLAALDETGELADTLVVFASDNGGVNKVRDSNKPYFGKKNTFYEGGLRTPLILSRPGTLPAGEIRAPVFIRDLMPSLLALVGLPVPQNLDGRDVTPLLRGEAVARDDRVFWNMASYGWSQRGVLNLNDDYLAFGRQIQRRASGKDYFSGPRVIPPAALQQVENTYRNWFASVSTVAVAQTLNESARVLTGDSYRRTPGYGAWTFQVPVTAHAAATQLADQDGHFSLHQDGSRVVLDLPGARLQQSLGHEECQLLTVSSYYQWSVRRPGKSIGHVALRLGDKLVQSVSFPLQGVQLADAYPPLLLSKAAGEPVISNRFLTDDVSGYYRRASGQAISCVR